MKYNRQKWFETFEMKFDQPFDEEKHGYKFTREMIENTLKYVDTLLKMETDPHTGEMSKHPWIEPIKTLRGIAISDLATLNLQQREFFHKVF